MAVISSIFKKEPPPNSVGEDEVKLVIMAESAAKEDIKPDDVVAWLVTQPNANGTLYLENVARTYMSALRKAPQKLVLEASQNRNVFRCHTASELDELRATFWAAPNYINVNKTLWRGQLSAGLVVYRRYLEHLEKNNDTTTSSAFVLEQPEVKTVTEVGEPRNTYNFQSVDLKHLERDAQTTPLSYTIDGSKDDVFVPAEQRSQSVDFVRIIPAQPEAPELVEKVEPQKIRELSLVDSNYSERYIQTTPLSCTINGSEDDTSVPTEQMSPSTDSVEMIPEQPTVPEIAKKVEPQKIQEFSRVDFNHPERYAQTKPQTCTINGKDVVLTKQNWPQLLVAVTERFIADGNPNLESLNLYPQYGNRVPLYGDRVFFLPKKAPYSEELSNGKWVYTNYTTRAILIIIRNLCQHCGIDLDDVVITYKPKGSVFVRMTQEARSTTTASSATPVHFQEETSNAVNKIPALSPTIERTATSILTLKEAVVRVLNDVRQPMGAKDIYKRIINEGLYSFATQLPVDAIRTIIESSCENSNNNRDVSPLFCCNKNNYGKKVYRLLLKENPEVIAEKASGANESVGPTVVDDLPDTLNTPNKNAVVDSTPALIIDQLADVLSTHFSNGYRLNSPIEIARFRSFFAEDFGKPPLLSDDELKSCIVASGTTHDGKVYVISNEVKGEIKEQAEAYFADGARAIFFSEFYAKNESWLFEACVVSEDMLVGIFHKLFPRMRFTATYFGYADTSLSATLESEILRAWGDDVLLTYDQLADRLLYIPLDRIKFVLGQNSDFIWSSTGIFAHISRIKITDEESQTICEAAMRECDICGYVAVASLPFGEIEEHNYELSVSALHDAVYRICLSDRFDRKGKIITRKGDIFDELTIMKEYCRTIDKCSLDDLLDFEKALTGVVDRRNRRIPMEAGNAILVRIDKETYVADRYVHFDTVSIDEAIELFVEGDYLPLKAFTTFAAFPDCGQTWNLFLLESYCRRFSRKFLFDAPTFNSRNAGAVIRKNCGKNYIEIMTEAVANADVPLKETDVGRFLSDSGYTGRSTNAKIGEIIDKAKIIRGGSNDAGN